MKTKSFSLKINDSISLDYGYKVQNKKWNFAFGSNTVLVACKGQGQAHKVANIICGAIKRTGGMDGLARKNISTVIS